VSNYRNLILDPRGGELKKNGVVAILEGAEKRAVEALTNGSRWEATERETPGKKGKYPLKERGGGGPCCRGGGEKIATRDELYFGRLCSLPPKGQGSSARRGK